MTDLLVSLFVLVVLALLMLAGAESHPVRALARYEAPRMTAAMLTLGRRRLVVAWGRV